MISLDDINRITWRELRPSCIKELIRQYPEFFPPDWNPTDEQLQKVLEAVSQVNAKREQAWLAWIEE